MFEVQKASETSHDASTWGDEICVMYATLVRCPLPKLSLRSREAVSGAHRPKAEHLLIVLPHDLRTTNRRDTRGARNGGAESGHEDNSNMVVRREVDFCASTPAPLVATDCASQAPSAGFLVACRAL